MRIIPLQTGLVRVKKAQIAGEGRGLQRRLHTFTSSGWGDWLPIYAWLIEHPEGLYLVDTGETSRVMQSGYFPRWHPYFSMAVQMNVQPDDEINVQLAKHGIKPNDLRAVILTHLHTDHAGGLAHFTKNRILVTREEYKLGNSMMGRLLGYLPYRWPRDFHPELIDYHDQPAGAFRKHYPITQDGSILLVPTPGHSVGHASVIVKDENFHIFLAGDISYTEEHLLRGTVDGVSGNDQLVQKTQKTVQAYLQAQPTIYLPSHDPRSVARLEQKLPAYTSQNAVS